MCRVGVLAEAAARVVATPALHHVLTRLAEPLMVKLVQGLLQLQALPVLLLDSTDPPVILELLLDSQQIRCAACIGLRPRLDLACRRCRAVACH